MDTNPGSRASRPIGRWLLVGVLFTALTVPMLHVSRVIVGLPLFAASAITWEIGTLLRFLVTDRWVFGQRRPTLQRFWQYHLAVAGSFFIWWAGTNVLPCWGLHYLVASVLATGCSLGWSVITSFFWVWRRRAAPRRASPPSSRA